MVRILLVLASILICQLPDAIHAQFTYLNQSCGTNVIGEYHEENLNQVLKTLNSKTSSTQFYNSTTGETKFKVYGLFQCRYDVSSSVCSACVDDATQKIKEVCPLSPDAIVWYNECMLRYASHNIFSQSRSRPYTTHASDDTITNYARFEPILEETLNALIVKASAASPHFASNTTSLSLSESGYLYSFAQCTPDITVSRCKECLENGYDRLNNRCCKASVYVTVSSPSCILSYDTTGPILNDHYQSSDDPSSENSPSDDHSPGTSAAGRRKISLTSTITTWAILACFLGSTMIPGNS